MKVFQIEGTQSLKDLLYYKKRWLKSRFPSRKKHRYYRIRLATAVAFLRSCGSVLPRHLSRGDWPHHSLYYFGVIPRD